MFIDGKTNFQSTIKVLKKRALAILQTKYNLECGALPTGVVDVMSTPMLKSMKERMKGRRSRLEVTLVSRFTIMRGDGMSALKSCIDNRACLDDKNE